jgi:DNA-binding NarL/FixJ family response regulator
MTSSHIIIADQHPLFRETLREDLAKEFGEATIAEAGSLEELSAALRSDQPVDLLLLDLAMPGMGGCSGVTPLRTQYPDLSIVLVSANGGPEAARRAVELGVAGFIPKTQPAEAIRETVRIALAGGAWVPPEIESDKEADARNDELRKRLETLTPQQIRVLTMLSEGLLNKQIAYELIVSEATVKAHVSAILQKLGVESRTQAVIAVNAIEGIDWKKGPPGSG